MPERQPRGFRGRANRESPPSAPPKPAPAVPPPIVSQRLPNPIFTEPQINNLGKVGERLAEATRQSIQTKQDRITQMNVRDFNRTINEDIGEFARKPLVWGNTVLRKILGKEPRVLPSHREITSVAEYRSQPFFNQNFIADRKINGIAVRPNWLEEAHSFAVFSKRTLLWSPVWVPALALLGVGRALYFVGGAFSVMWKDVIELGKTFWHGPGQSAKDVIDPLGLRNFSVKGGSTGHHKADSHGH